MILLNLEHSRQLIDLQKTLHPVRNLPVLLTQIFGLTSRSVQRGIHFEDQGVHAPELALHANFSHMYSLAGILSLDLR